MKIRYIVVLCFLIFVVFRLGLLAIEVVKTSGKSKPSQEAGASSANPILIVKAKIDDADCSLSLAVASSKATDKDFLDLVPRVENSFRNAVAYVFSSKESAVYPQSAQGGFVDEKDMSHVIGVVTCNVNGYQEVVRYEPNMRDGKARVLFHKPSGK
jgi:hypothetical protein